MKRPKEYDKHALKFTALILVVLSVGCAQVSKQEFEGLEARVQGLEDSIGKALLQNSISYRISLLKAERAQLLTRFKPEHIKIKGLDAQIQELEKELLKASAEDVTDEIIKELNKKYESDQEAKRFP